MPLPARKVASRRKLAGTRALVLLATACACGDSQESTERSQPERGETPLAPGRAPGPPEGDAVTNRETESLGLPRRSCEPAETRPCGTAACPGVERCIEPLSGGSTWQPCDVSGAFLDPALQASMRSELDAPEGPLFEFAVSRLGSVEVTSQGLSRLDGLECAPGLTRADLFDNQLTSLAPLAGLSELTLLSLQGNTISDLAPLAGLRQLQALLLHANAISDVGPLAGLTRLEQLFLSGNQISDLTPLAGLRELRLLYLGTNQLSDLRPLASLRRLTVLELSDNAISDLGPLAALPELVELQLQGNQIRNVEPLLALPALQRISLVRNPLDCEAESFVALRARLRPLTSDCP